MSGNWPETRSAWRRLLTAVAEVWRLHVELWRLRRQNRQIRRLIAGLMKEDGAPHA